MPETMEPRGMFAEKKAERTFPIAAVAIASLAVVFLAGFLVFLGRRHAVAPNTVLPAAAEAQSLEFKDVQMSESTSLSGGKSTYIDGKIASHLQSTVTGVTVQVLFRNDEAMPPQVETLPLMLIRTRQPYIDTEPVSSDPLSPGAEREFRLIFENIGANWNQQQPEIRIVAVKAK